MGSSPDLSRGGLDHRPQSRRTAGEPYLIVIGPTSRGAVTGLSTAFETLLAELRFRGISHRLIDTAPANPHEGGGGLVSARRAAEVLRVIGSAVSAMPRAGRLYMTMGGSVPGMLRDLAVVSVAHRHGIPTILHLHGGGYDELYARSHPLVRRAIRAMLRQVDVLIVLGELLSKQFDFLDDSQRPRIAVVPNGVDVDRPPAAPRSIRMGEPLRLLYLSNLIPSKGYLQLLEAVHLLRSWGVGVECDFAGEFIRVGRGEDALEVGAARQRFERRIAELRLERAVRYHGTVSGEDKWKLLERTDVFVLPTRYPGEGQPISIIEALSRGVPVVSTRYRGIPEQVRPGDNGALIDPSDVTPEAIARAVKEIVSNPANYTRLSAGALRTYRERFTRQQHLEQLMALIEGKGSPAGRGVG